MKKIVIIVCICIFAVSALFAAEQSVTAEPQAVSQPAAAAGDTYAQEKHFYMGAFINLGMSNMQKLQSATEDNSAGFSFAIQIGGTYYFGEKAHFGIHYTIGYERLCLTNNSGKTWSHIIPLNIGFAMQFSGIFLNLGISYGFHAGTYSKADGADNSIKWLRCSTVVMGFYANPGYRIKAGSIFIPVGLEFKYYFTSVTSQDNNAKWWQINVKFGIEI